MHRYTKADLRDPQPDLMTQEHSEHLIEKGLHVEPPAPIELPPRYLTCTTNTKLFVARDDLHNFLTTNLTWSEVGKDHRGVNRIEGKCVARTDVLRALTYVESNLNKLLDLHKELTEQLNAKPSNS